MATEISAGLSVPSRRDPVLAEMVRRLAEVYHSGRIYLFGSVAQGEAGLDRDYDLMVLVPDDTPPERLRSRIGYRLVREGLVVYGA